MCSVCDVEVRCCALNETEENTPGASVKESFHWLLETPVALPVSSLSAHTLHRADLLSLSLSLFTAKSFLTFC